jgi:hypothetical protein
MHLQLLRPLVVIAMSANSDTEMTQTSRSNALHNVSTALSRTDLQGGNAEALYNSIHETLYTLPASTTVWPGRFSEGINCSSIGEEKAYNSRLRKPIAEFTAFMQAQHLQKPFDMNETLAFNKSCGTPASVSEEVQEALQ